jgi:cbb3-type cytochrome oxidase subunit 3
MKNLLADSMLLAQINLKQQAGQFSDATNLTVEDIVGGFLRLILVVAGLVFFFILVIGGIKWIMSGGDKAHTEGARNQITAALVGLVIVFSAWAIVELIRVFFGVNLFELKIPSAVTGQ